MREVLLDVTASLAATISLLEKSPVPKAVASDKMFAVMMDDYRKSLARARKALKEMNDGKQI